MKKVSSDRMCHFLFARPMSNQDLDFWRSLSFGQRETKMWGQNSSN